MYNETFEHFSKEALESHDELYLRICVNLHAQRMRTPERKEAKRIDLGLIEAIQEIKNYERRAIKNENTTRKTYI